MEHSGAHSLWHSPWIEPTECLGDERRQLHLLSTGWHNFEAGNEHRISGFHSGIDQRSGHD